MHTHSYSVDVYRNPPERIPDPLVTIFERDSEGVCHPAEFIYKRILRGKTAKRVIHGPRFATYGQAQDFLKKHGGNTDREFVITSSVPYAT